MRNKRMPYDQILKILNIHRVSQSCKEKHMYHPPIKYQMLHFFLFERVYVRIDGQKGQKCTKKSPCDYENINDKLKQGETLVFSDSFLEGKENTKKFRTLVNSALKKGMNIDCSNVIVNGTFSEFFSPSFIVFPSNYYGSFSNAVFTNFKTTVFSLTKVKDTTLENIYLQNCNMKWRTSLVEIKGSSLLMSNISFSQIIENDLPLISIEKSTITMHNNRMFHCFAIHGMKIPLLLMRNTNLLIHKSSFLHVNTPVSPMLRSEGKGGINVVESEFIDGTHTAMFYIDGSAVTEIKDSKFEGNQGPIYETKEGSSLEVLNTTIVNCGAAEKSLFYILRSTSSISNCTFTNCAAPTLINSVGSSKVVVSETLFENNKPHHACIGADIHGHAETHNCKFINTISKDGVISGERNSDLLVNMSEFVSSWSPSVLLLSSSAKITNCSFKESFAEGKRSVLGDKSTLNMEACEFFDSSLSGLILNSGRNKLSSLTFNATRERSIPNSLQLLCNNCKFIEVHETAEYDKHDIVITLICALVASGFAMFGKDRIYGIMKHCFSKRKYD